MPTWKVAPEDVPQLLKSLACSDPETQQKTLQRLCPCRSQCEDLEIWTAICQTYYDDCAEPMVRNQAQHALETLIQKAPHSLRSAQLLQSLQDRQLLALPLEKEPPTRKRKDQPVRVPKERITSRDVPRLLETLTSCDPEAKQKTLRTLCPCRNVRYDRDIWLAIFQAYDAGETGHVRDQAFHAIETLLQRVKKDPRSQELLSWLAEQGIACLPLVENIPTWDPLGRAGMNGLYIPRFERSSRSKANRRR